ncbi:MAG TPA: VOC family protein [Nocardioidaceae bacterium]
MTKWGLTVDCAEPAELAEFWTLALGYEQASPPEGFASWHEWLDRLDVPEEEWDDAAYLNDPAGAGPSLSFLKVPEGKIVKNRLHIDLKVGGGRQTPWDVRWPKVLDMVERLTAAGGTVQRIDEINGQGDHVVMEDPEGNEFCVL